jgi:hypothetical protein
MTPSTPTHSPDSRAIRVRGTVRDDAEAARALAKLLLDVAEHERDG